MKRLSLIIFIVALLIMAASVPAEAAFNLAITQHSEGIHFGNVNMGSTTYDIPANGMIVSCTTNGTVGWTLDVEARDELTSINASDHISTMSNTNFKWYVVSASQSNSSYTPQARNDFRVRRTVYTGLNGETQVDITMQFELVVPAVFQAGTYNIPIDGIVFTLTE
jgi:hypothetical protein